MDDIDDFDSLLRVARRVQRQMRRYEALRGRPFPHHAVFLGALDLIESGLASHDRLEVAVGYMALRDLFERIQSENTARN